VGLFGKNRQGKSSVFTALTFAIFGRPIKKIALNEMIRYGTRSGESVVDIQKGSSLYRITRNLKLIGQANPTVNQKIKFEIFEGDH